MKILLDALQAGNRSGTGRYTEELLKGLPSVDERLELFPFVPSNLDRSILSVDAEKSILVDTDRLLGGSRYRDKLVLKDIKRIAPDIVHYTATIGSQAKRRKWDTSKVVVTVHDLAFLRNPEWFKKDRAVYYKKKIKKTVEYADRIIADSCATADDLMLFLEVSEDIIDVVPLGVDEQYKPVEESDERRVREKYNLPDEFFLYVGTIEPRKNIEGIVEAFSSIASKVPHDLVIAGRDGWKVKPIRKAIKKSAVSDRIHLPGFIGQEDLPALLSCAHAFVWPSLWEGFGLPPLEAMACGTPVLTSDMSSLPEVVGRAAISVDPFDIDLIARGMLTLATDESVCKGLRNSGFNRASKFPWDLCVKMTYDVYERALNV
ncbi:MAG: glycosyltransferase family 1 protein [Candidatus Hydrogenedentota bacterium]